MRAIIILSILASSTARANDLVTLEKRGERLAKEGHYSDAIDAFKQADKRTPRASHACLIALAYTRRELWPQAEIFFAACKQRASASDPAPDWLPLAETTLEEHLASASVAPVEIVVHPAGATAMLAVSSFAHDETFAPRTIHLAFGDHVITAKAPGYVTVNRRIVIADKKHRRVTLTLRPETIIRHAREPWFVVGGGGALIAAGAAVHLFAVNPLHDRLAADVRDPEHLDTQDYLARSHAFDVRRDVAIGLYAIGGATVIAGLILRETVWSDREVSVVATPLEHGGIVTLTWRTP